MTRYYDYLYAYIASRTSFEEARDIVQEVYLSAIVSRKTLSDEGRLKAWLCGIADNKIKQHFRRLSFYRRRHTDFEDSENLSSSDGTYDRLIAKAGSVRLRHEISLLPDDLRLCTVVSLMCGLSGDDSAEILGVPRSTVYNRVHKVKKILRERLDDIMEIPFDVFSAILDETRKEVERTAEHLEKIYDLSDAQKYDELAELLLTAPVLAADSAMAHYIIMQNVAMAVRIMREPSRAQLFPGLKKLGETEFRLAEKLGFKGIIDDENGEEIPEYTFYIGASDFFLAFGDFDRAIEMFVKAKAFGCKSEMQYAMICQERGQYREAVEVYMLEAEKAKETDVDRYMAYNRISNCLRELGDINGQLEYQLKNYEAVKSRVIYSDPESNAHFLSGEAYYLAMTYAALDDKSNCMKYLAEAVSIDPRFSDWAKGSASFSKFREDDDFIALCGAGEGKPYSIH